MAAICWTEVRGQKFSDAEAQEASDFQEILYNFDLKPSQVFELFQKQPLTVAKRLVLAETVPLDGAAVLLLAEADARIREVIQGRIKQENLHASGGIHIG